MDTQPIVFLIDVDDTLLKNDLIQEDFRNYLEQSFGTARRDRYWTIQEKLFQDIGYRDYLGAAQQLRDEFPFEVELLALSSFFLDYPFASRLYPDALEVLAKLRSISTTAILSDGDVIFQPRKVELAGIHDAVGGKVLIYIHKEEALEDVERRLPADRYILIDDKLRILAAVKDKWRDRVTTIFVRQGKFANDPSILARYPEADFSVNSIGELLEVQSEVFAATPKDMIELWKAKMRG